MGSYEIPGNKATVEELIVTAEFQNFRPRNKIAKICLSVSQLVEVLVQRGK